MVAGSLFYELQTIESPCPNNLDAMSFDVLQGVVDVLRRIECRKPVSIGAHEFEFTEKEEMKPTRKVEM